MSSLLTETSPQNLYYHHLAIAVESYVMCSVVQASPLGGGLSASAVRLASKWYVRPSVDVSCVTCDTLLGVCCDIMPLPGSENAVAKCNSVIFLFELCLCFSYCDLLECPLTKVYFAQSSVTDQWASAQLYCSVRCMKLLLFKNSFSPDITVTGHYSLQWIIVQFRGCIRSIHNWLWK